MDNDEKNLISLISEFNRSYFGSLEDDIPPTLMKKLNKMMVNNVFKFSRKYEETPSTTTESVHSLIMKRILSLLPAGDFFVDDGRRVEICNCLTALEELCNENNNSEELNDILICLYTLSKLTHRKKRRRFKNVSRSFVNRILSRDLDDMKKKYETKNSVLPLFSNLNELYLDSARFNDINWKVFHSKKPDDVNLHDTDKELLNIQESLISTPSNNLYLNSPCFNDINWDVFKVSNKEDCNYVQRSTGLYLNSPRFNDINWNAFRLETHYEQNLRKKGLNTSSTSTGCQLPNNLEPFKDLFKYKVWNFDAHRLVEPLLPDEGFITPGSNFSEEHDDPADSSDSEIMLTSSSISVVDAEDGQPERYVWEHPGKPYLSKEPRFVTEYPECILHVWKIWNASRKSLTHPALLGLMVSFEEYRNDVNHLLFGVASNCFYFAPTTHTFHIREKLHLLTVTPETLANFSQLFIDCGNNFVALKNYAETESKATNCGPVFHVFCGCIRKLLQLHRYCLLKINWDCIDRLLQLEAISSPLLRKLSFSKDLCSSFIEKPNCDDGLPRGVRLLDHLYENLVKIETTDLKFLLLFFFEDCCNAYLRIVSEWIFSGCFSNSANYDEFFIQIQHELEVCWDWRRLGYVRMNEKRVPKFLRKFFKDIFACGKSVNLLKIFSKREIFERILPTTYPNIRCCFNAAQTEVYALEWKRFQDQLDKKHKWSVKLKDRLTDNYGAVFRNKVKEAHRKKLEEKMAKSVEDNRRSIDEHNEKTEENTIKRTASTSEVSGNQPLTASSDGQKYDPSFDQNSSHTVNGCGDAPTGNAPNLSTFSPATSERTNAVDTKLRTRLTVTRPLSVCEETKNSTPSSRDTSFASMGETDCERNRLKSTASDYQNQLSAPSTPVSRRKSLASIEKNDCERNRLKSTASDYQNQLSAPSTPVLQRKTVAPACERNRLKSTASDYQNQLSAPSTPILQRKSVAPAEETDYDRNRLKSSASDYQSQLSKTSEIPQVPQTHDPNLLSTPLSVCAQNRLKNMSTTFDEDQIKSNAPRETPITDCMRNKIKVMRSEYCERLSMANCPETKDTAVVNQRELNENEKNKLKVMASEYHIRLNALADQEETINNKLLSRIGKSTEQPVKDPKICSEESNQPLKVNHNLENSTADLVVDGENTINTSAITSEQEEPSVSEDLVTVIENAEKSLKTDHNTIPILHPPKNERLLNMERYSKYPHVFKRPGLKTASRPITGDRSIKNVDFSSVLYYLSPSISIPLQIQSKLVNEAILWVFIEQEGYLEHLKALRNYVFLRKAEFALSLTNSLFEMSEEVRKPSLLLNSYTLNSILQRALSGCNSKNARKFERNLSINLEDTIPDSFNLTDVQMLRCLSMHYVVKWPVNVLITEPIMKKYSRVFRFLIQLERVSWVLKSDFKDMKNLKRGKSIQHTQIQLYRHSMTQIIRLLNRFIAREALEQCWNDLVSHLTTIKIDLDELYMSHLRYVNKIIQRCFLCEESVPCHKAIFRVLESVLMYHEAQRKGLWRRNEECNLLYHTNFKNLQTIHKEFWKNVHNFRVQLEVLIYQKQKLYFEPLFLELNNCNTGDETVS